MIALSLPCLLAGCGSQPEPVASVENLSSPKVVSIVGGETPTESDQEAMVAAKDALFQRLSGRLMEVMGSAGPAAAIAVCKSEATTIAREVGDDHGLTIGRTGVRLRNAENQSPLWAKSLTDQKAEQPHFVTLDDGRSAALLPIKLQAKCLMCHGPEDQIAPVIQEQLAKHYPDDKATGFREGELRGWFWIEKPAL